MANIPSLNNIPKGAQYIYDSVSGTYRPTTSADLAGGGGTTQIKVKDSNNNDITLFNPLPTVIGGPSSTAFGEVLTAQSIPQIQAYLNSLKDDRIWNQYTGEAGGTFSIGSGAGAISIDNTILGYATIQTREQISYKPGESSTMKFTAQFDAPVANSLQLVGPYHAEDGFGVGYNGTQFGMFHRYGRRLHIAKLTVTGAATQATTATITLNGQPNTVPIPIGGDVKNDARNIATGTKYFDRGFFKANNNAFAIGSSVYFTRETHGPITGEYSYTLAAGDGGGQFSIFSSGIDGTTDWFYQTGWNLDKMDGSGISNMTLNPQAINVYQINFGWLGSLPTLLYIANSGFQQMSPVNLHKWTNIKSGVHTYDPRFPITYAVASAGSSTPLTLKGGSCYASLNGLNGDLGPEWSFDNEKIANTTESLILGVQNSRIDLGKLRFNRRRVFLNEVLVSNESSTKSATIRIYKGNRESVNNSVYLSDNIHSDLLYDTSGTQPNTSLNNYKKIRSIPLAPSSTEAIDLKTILQPADVVFATIQTNSSTAPISCSFNGKEDL